MWRDVAYGMPLTAQDFDLYSAARQKLRSLFALIEDMRTADPEECGPDGAASDSTQGGDMSPVF